MKTLQSKHTQTFTTNDILVSDDFKNAVNFPYVFKPYKVDNEFGVVYYEYNTYHDSVGFSYIRKANLFERIIYYITRLIK